MYEIMHGPTTACASRLDPAADQKIRYLHVHIRRSCVYVYYIYIYIYIYRERERSYVICISERAPVTKRRLECQR